MEITCLGYKTAFTGNKMWYYKVDVDNQEYLVVNASMSTLLDMKWTEKNDFENADFSGEIYNEIESKIDSISKKEHELGEDEEKTFFKQYEIKPEEPKVELPKNGVYSRDDINDILGIFDEFDFTYEGKGKVNQEMIDYAHEEGYGNLLDELLNYKVSIKTDGDHRNDGQLVDYDFTFESPSGKKTKFSTEMCLMVGWNYHAELNIR